MKEPAKVDAFYWINKEIALDRVDPFDVPEALEDQFDESAHGRFHPLDAFVEDLLAFFADRLKVHLRDEGIRYDVIDAVFALGDDDLVRVTAKARALQAFLDTEDGAALLAGYNRASNIVRAEEKKDGEGAFEGELEAGYLAAAPEDQERALIAAVNTVKGEAQQALVAENFEAAMAALATLRAPIDAFFEHVTVNSEDAALRRNRLFLLSQIRTAVRAVADFDRIAG